MTELDNLLKNYGRPKTLRLVVGLVTGVSGEQLAQELGVTRERIRQWKHVLGVEQRVYCVDPEVVRALRLSPANVGQAAPVDQLLREYCTELEKRVRELEAELARATHFTTP